jgi:hypothetical protein
MAKRKVRSQITNLTLDHYKLGIALIYLRVGGVPKIIGKNLVKGYNFVLNVISIEGLHKKSWVSKVA